MTAHKIALRLAGGSILALVLLVGVACLCGWDRLWCMHTDIDVQGGQVRSIRYVAFVPVRETIEATAFSRLASKYEAKAQEPVWKRVTTISWLTKVSPHYEYHSAIAACDSIMLVFKAFPVTEAYTRTYVRKCLAYLRDGEIDKIERLAKDAWAEQEAKAAHPTTHTAPPR